MGADTEYVGAISVQPPIPLEAFEGGGVEEGGYFELLVLAGRRYVGGLVATDECKGKSHVLEGVSAFLEICRRVHPDSEFHSALRYSDIDFSGRIAVTDSGWDWEADKPQHPATTITVVTVTFQLAHGPDGVRRGLAAEVDVVLGFGRDRYRLSRLEGETGWSVDVHFAPQGAMPVSRPFGDRTQARVAADPLVAATADAAALERGLAEPGGPAAPLVIR